MPIPWSTEHPEPNFPENTFGTELTHVKNIYGYLLTDLAYFNPLADDIDAMVARIDVVIGLLATEISAATADAAEFGAWAGNSFLPTGWNDAYLDGLLNYDANNGAALASTVASYASFCTAVQTNLTTLKDYVTVIDIDNFKLHMELLSGIDDAPPRDIIKPNNPALMGVAMGLIQLEHRFGIASFYQFPFHKADGTLGSVPTPTVDVGGEPTQFPFYQADGTLDNIIITSGQFPFYQADGTLFNMVVSYTNHLLGLFGTLFTGDVTIAAAQAHLDTDPFSGGTYASLNISSNVNKAYVSGATGDALPWENSIVSAKIATITPSITAYDAPIISTHKAALTTHITDDMAYFDMCQHRLNSFMLAYGISGHIHDPFFAYMYTDVFGTATLNVLIQQYLDGEIT
jgi:hypothetical protein